MKTSLTPISVPADHALILLAPDGLGYPTREWSLRAIVYHVGLSLAVADPHGKAKSYTVRECLRPWQITSEGRVHVADLIVEEG